MFIRETAKLSLRSRRGEGTVLNTGLKYCSYYTVSSSYKFRVEKKLH